MKSWIRPSFFSLLLLTATPALVQAAGLSDEHWNSNRELYLKRVNAIADDARIAIQDARQIRWRKALIGARIAKLEQSYELQTTVYGVSILPFLSGPDAQTLGQVRKEMDNARAALQRGDFQTISSIARRVASKLR